MNNTIKKIYLAQNTSSFNYQKIEENHFINIEIDSIEFNQDKLENSTSIKPETIIQFLKNCNQKLNEEVKDNSGNPQIDSWTKINSKGLNDLIQHVEINKIFFSIQFNEEINNIDKFILSGDLNVNLKFFDCKIGKLKHKFKLGSYSGKISFFNCTIKKKLHFQNIHFNKLVEFNNCTFKDLVVFERCNFESNVVFTNSTFEKNILFPYTTFEKTGIFSRTKFKKNKAGIDLSQSIINGSLTFFGSDLDNFSSKYISPKNAKFEQYIIGEIDNHKIPIINKIETFRILKHQAKNLENTVDFLKFSRLEKIGLKELYKKKFKKNIGNYLILKANEISNNHNQSFLRGLSFTFILAIIFGFLMENGLQLCYFFESPCNNWEKIWQTSLSLINPLTIINSNMEQKLTLTYILGKTIVAYGIYQTIQAFRKFR